MRYAEISRKTRETDIKMRLELDQAVGQFSGSSGVGFFDHMLTAFAVHGGFLISLEMTGDLQVDCHHTIEDCGIVLGNLFAQILGNRAGISRFGECSIPMDEALAFAAVDIGGRPYIVCDGDFKNQFVGQFDTQMTAEFFRALAFNMQATLHIRAVYGDNDHHKIEAMFKAVARAISQAVKIRGIGEKVLSSKGL